MLIRWSSNGPGPWPAGRAEPNRQGRAGTAARQARAELRRNVRKMAFPAPVFIINTFSKFRVLNQTHLVILDRTIAKKVATNMMIYGWNASNSLEGISTLQIDVV